MIISVCVTIATQLGLAYVLYLRYINGQFPSSALNFSPERPERIFFAAVTYSALLFVLLSIVTAVINQIEPNLPKQYSDVFAGVPKSLWWFFLLSAVILAPVVEEVFFRGYLLPIIAARGQFRGLVISSTIFSLLHIPSLQTFINFFIVGYILGYAYLRTKNVLTNILIHAIKNSLAFAAWYFGR